MMGKITSIFRSFEEELPLVQLAGPLFVLCTVAVAAKYTGVFHYDLLIIGAIGLFLCAKWKIKGCVYALVLLALSTFFTHAMLFDGHAFQFGLEGSIAFAFLISGLGFEEGSLFLQSLSQKIGVKEQTIQHLEEEIGRQRDQTGNGLVLANNKIASLTKDLEELQSEMSALQVLNDVLRKTSAKTAEEKEALVEGARNGEQKIAQLVTEIEAQKKELARIQDESTVAQQNKELFAEINEVRFKEEQTHLINETLVRLHAKEAQKSADLEAKAQLLAAEKEKAIEELSFARREAAMNATQLNQLSTQLQSLKQTNNGLEQIQAERNFLRERLASAEAELKQKRERVTALEAECRAIADKQNAPGILSSDEALLLRTEKEHLLKQIEELRGHLSNHAQTEALYQQLRAQFEEKNQVLHQTRAQLFHTDTAFQTIRQELESRNLESDPLAAIVREELTKLEDVNRELDAENQQLHEIVSHLMSQPKDPSILSAISPHIKKK